MLTAVLAMALAACGSGAPSASPSTRTISRQPPASATSPPASAPTTSPPAGTPAPTTSPPAGTPLPTPSPPAGAGLRGRTVVLNCPVDRADPPCPAIPVQARVVVLNKNGRTTLATVDTDADGWFTVALPAGSYQIRASGTGSSQARRPAIRQVTVAAGHYTTVTVRLITGLR